MTLFEWLTHFYKIEQVTKKPGKAQKVPKPMPATMMVAKKLN